MKNNIIKVAVFISCITAISCNKELDTEPSVSIDKNLALQTSDDVKALLIGAYRDLGTANFYGGRIFMEADLLADVNEMDWTGTYQGLTQIKNKTIPVDNDFVSGIWLSGYRAINDVNNVIGALNVVNPNDSSSVAAEARFIRGAAYFDLVRLFAKAWNDGDPTANEGVPIVLTPTTEITEASKVKRAKVAEVYAQAISDLQLAEANLPETNGVYATKAAAAAMLSRVYLQQQDYVNARDAADRAITYARSNGGVLVKNYADAFGATNTSEDIFAIQVTATAGTQGFNEFYSSSQRGDIQITNTHLDLYESGDKRANLFYEDGGSVYTGKFEELYGNVHIIRLAEMFLTRAECNFRLGTTVGATPVSDINRIRERAGLTPYTASELTLDKILMERHLELAFEGFWLHDIKRLEGSVGNLPWNSPKLIFPIPQREIRANPNLTQNEGY